MEASAGGEDQVLSPSGPRPEGEVETLVSVPGAAPYALYLWHAMSITGTYVEDTDRRRLGYAWQLARRQVAVDRIVTIVKICAT